MCSFDFISGVAGVEEGIEVVKGSDSEGVLSEGEPFVLCHLEHNQISCYFYAADGIETDGDGFSRNAMGNFILVTHFNVGKTRLTFNYFLHGVVVRLCCRIYRQQYCTGVYNCDTEYDNKCFETANRPRSVADISVSVNKN